MARALSLGPWVESDSVVADRYYDRFPDALALDDEIAGLRMPHCIRGGFPDTGNHLIHGVGVQEPARLPINDELGLHGCTGPNHLQDVFKLCTEIALTLLEYQDLAPDIDDGFAYRSNRISQTSRRSDGFWWLIEYVCAQFQGQRVESLDDSVVKVHGYPLALLHTNQPLNVGHVAQDQHHAMI
jgi:hypothetical protein